MAKHNVLSILFIGLTLIVSHSVVAVETGTIKWSGFLNSGLAVSDSDVEYLPGSRKIDSTGSFSDTLLGLNMAVDLGPKLKMAAQITNNAGSSAANIDWGYGTYSLGNISKISVGRLKYPGNLISGYVDTGYAYLWIRPPQEMYNHGEVGATMTLEAFNGARLALAGDWGESTEYDLSLYFGAEDGALMNHDQLVGVRFSVSGEVLTFILNYNQSIMEMHLTKLVADLITGDVTEVEVPTPMDHETLTVMSAGVTADWKNMVGYLEVLSNQTSSVPELDTVAGYATIGFYIGRFLPHITYSALDQKSELGQKSITLGLRYELSSNSALKVEYQTIEATPASASAVATVPMLAGRAGLFASDPGKPVNIISIGVNFVF